MACAFDLAKFGYVVTAIDTNLPGGVPGSSIPPFRLSAEDLQDDVEFILEHLTYERKLIDAKHLTSLRDEYDAVFLGIGLGRDRSPGIEGEHLSGVYRVLDFLRRAKQGPRVIHLGKRVVVIGGGNVSLDAAATAKALGAEHVTLIYRRSLTEMRVWRSELDEAMARGVELRLLTFPVTITGETSVKGVLCQRTRLTDQRDATGRAVAVPIPGTEHLMPADSVIIAIGQEIGSGLASLFTLSSKGYIEVDGQYKTSLPGVFAGGDAIAGEGTIVQAVAHGKGAAKAIHRFLSAGGGR
jgi:NADPH-dependent glutamate synthase beta subunit-like oxidoreductase